MSLRPRFVVALFACIFCAACASTHYVRPLGKGNAVVHASAGGPLVELGGVVFPTPIATVGGGYGVRDDLDVFLHANATALAFGDLHLEPGVAWHPLIRDHGAVPTLTVAGSLHFLTDFHTAARAFPQVTVAGAWALGRRRHLVYTGLDLAVSFEGRALFGPFAGGELRVGRRVGLSLEVKWIAPYYDTTPVAPVWISPGSYGYVSVLLGINIYFGSVR
jgi:hypothetical protein